MKRSALLGILLATLGTCPSASLADDFDVDGSHTSIIFGVSHLGYSFTYGRFNRVTGSFSLGADLAASAFQLTIDAGSVDTNDPKRDEHLRGPDFFNARQFPLISFQSSKVVPRQTERGTQLTVTGNLTMHGVTREIQFDLLKLGEGPGPTGKDFRTGFICTTNLLRSEFGMQNMVPHIGDDVAITMSFEGVRRGAAPAGSTP
jgi:polyisoprenoid-binding protein YceI